MAIMRENAGAGAALFWLSLSGCLPADEAPLFRSVPAPGERTTDVRGGAGALPSEVAPDVAVNAPGVQEGPPPNLELDTSGAAMTEVSGEMLSPGSADAAGESTAESVDGPPAFDPCSGPGLAWCETFEDAAAGAFPETAPWLGELPGCGSHIVDESGVSSSGSRALRADAGGYPECMLHAELDGAGDVFVRSFIRLGSDPSLLEQYVSLIEWGPEESRDDPELRIGLRPEGGSLCTASPGLDVSVSGLASGPVTDCTGFSFEPERWYCVQARVARQGSRLNVSVAVDGETLLEQQYAGLGPSWNGRGSFLKLGRAAYGESAGGSLWHDDIAVGSEPLPCGP